MVTEKTDTPRPSADEIRKLVARLDEDMEDLLSTGDDSHVEDVARLCAVVESLLEDRELLDFLDQCPLEVLQRLYAMAGDGNPIRQQIQQARAALEQAVGG